jgi:hypothetical protein
MFKGICFRGQGSEEDNLRDSIRFSISGVGETSAVTAFRSEMKTAHIRERYCLVQLARVEEVRLMLNWMSVTTKGWDM